MGALASGDPGKLRLLSGINNSKLSFSIYYVPGMFSSIFTHRELNTSSKQPTTYVLLLFPLIIEEGSERLSKLPEVTQ